MYQTFERESDSDSIWIRRMQARMGLPKPLFKWPGIRTRALPELLPRIPSTWGRYFEPFSGSLSVFLALYRDERIEAATLGDVNYDLMDTYRMVRKHARVVTEVLRGWRHSLRLFEELCRVRRTSQWMPQDAARFIYLNQACSNGSYAVNEKGEFTSPYGNNKGLVVCDTDNIEAVSTALRDTLLFSGHFTGCLRDVEAGDFVFCDPGPIEKEERALWDALRCLSSKRVKWLLVAPNAERVQHRYGALRVEPLGSKELTVRNY